MVSSRETLVVALRGDLDSSGGGGGGEDDDDASPPPPLDDDRDSRRGLDVAMGSGTDDDDDEDGGCGCGELLPLAVVVVVVDPLLYDIDSLSLRRGRGLVTATGAMDGTGARGVDRTTLPPPFAGSRCCSLAPDNLRTNDGLSRSFGFCRTDSFQLRRCIDGLVGTSVVVVVVVVVAVVVPLPQPLATIP